MEPSLAYDSERNHQLRSLLDTYDLQGPPSLRRPSSRYLRILTNTLCPITLLVIGIILGKQSDLPESNIKIKTACYLSTGIITRAILQANLPAVVMENIHNTLARWSFEIFEILWNWFLNEENPEIRNGILNTITVLGGVQLAGDLMTAYTLKKEGRAYRTLNDIDLGADVVNKIIGPSFNNRRDQILLKTAQAIFGIGLIVFGFEGNTSLKVLCNSIGYFFAFKGIGFFGMETIVNLLEKKERSFEGQSLNSLRKQNISLMEKTLRSVGLLVPRLCAESIALIALMNRPELFIPGALLVGAAEYVNQREFQVLTPEVYEAQTRGNITFIEDKKFKKTALKVEEIMSVVFFTLFLGWFCFGLVDSVQKNKERDEISISVLMASVFITAILSKFADARFFPGKNGQVINNTRLLFQHHPYLLAIIYLGLAQMSAIDDQSLDRDSLSKFICGVVALAFYGAIVGSNRIRNISITRAVPAFSPPIFRMWWLKTVLERLLGRIKA